MQSRKQVQPLSLNWKVLWAALCSSNKGQHSCARPSPLDYRFDHPDQVVIVVVVVPVCSAHAQDDPSQEYDSISLWLYLLTLAKVRYHYDHDYIPLPHVRTRRIRTIFTIRRLLVSHIPLDSESRNLSRR